jgi:RNA polymerase sigma-70 factor, ECF subfamily
MNLAISKFDDANFRMIESDLLTSAQQGNLEAFNQLVLEHQQDVYNLAFWIVKDGQTAEDITQDTFLKAYQRIEQFHGGSFRGWLFRVAKNASIDELRRHKRHRIDPLLLVDCYCDNENVTPDWTADSVSVQHNVENNELYAAISIWIRRLHTNYSIPIILIDIMTMNYEEAASVMNVPIGTIKSRVYRARNYLRKQIKHFHKESSQQKEGFYSTIIKKTEV